MLGGRRLVLCDKESRWLTLEFLGYYTVLAWAMAEMAISAWRFSRPEHASYGTYRQRLSPSPWCAACTMDNSDRQYAGFRDHLPELLGLMLLVLAINRLSSRRLRWLSTGLTMLLLHGWNCLKILAITVIVYYLGRLGGRRGRILLWPFIIGLFFAMEWMTLPTLPVSLPKALTWPGFYPRWHILFKVSCLRLISYVMDVTSGPQKEAANSPSSSLISAKDLLSIDNNPPPSLRELFEYAYYPPLYFAGPIVTFEDFRSQRITASPDASVRWPSVARYAGRWLACFVLMELMLHGFHVVAIKDARAFEGFSPLDYGALGFLNLKLVWLKLLLIWRFFRLMALMDGVESPENMVSSHVRQSVKDAHCAQ
jgi:D-alanyl-lipoteichoic acid acyltransferase DltB (MBOAT superfamily)